MIVLAKVNNVDELILRHYSMRFYKHNVYKHNMKVKICRFAKDSLRIQAILKWLSIYLSQIYPNFSLNLKGEKFIFCL